MEHEKLSGLLPDGLDKTESDELDATWRMLGAIGSPAPDSERMRARLDGVIDAVEHVDRGPEASAPLRSGPRTFHSYVLQGLAAAAMLIIGIGIGWFAAGRTGGSAFGGSRPASNDSTAQIAALRSEMHDLREMVSLSLMQQQSATERLKGVTWTGQLDRPSGEVVSALLDALMHDPNVNVRLATIDALERFASREEVRRGTIQAVAQQPSPLVQIALIDFMVKTNERESVPALRRLAMDPQANDAVRARAAWGLQQLG
jgi:HEAT repeats